MRWINVVPYISDAVEPHPGKVKDELKESQGTFFFVVIPTTSSLYVYVSAYTHDSSG